MTVELVYDAGCPNVAEARGNILRAFGLANLPPAWTEWEQSGTDAPGRVRGFGSPTVLVNGRDVAGAEPARDLACCRLYQTSDQQYRGAPSADLIFTALHDAAGRPDWKRRLLMLPGVGLAVLPKLACPACWPAYAGVLSALGLGFLLSTTYLLPLTLIFLGVAVAMLGLEGRRQRRHGPFLAGMTASVFILAGKFAWESKVVMYTSLTALVAASLWTAWPRRRCAYERQT